MAAPPTPPRPLRWVPSALYAAVLAGGLYYETLGEGSLRLAGTAGFVTCLLLLFALEAVERGRYPEHVPTRPAVLLLAARLGLYAAVSALDEAGVSRALFVLVPFTAYFALGRTAALVASAGCLGLLLTGNVLWVPRWWATAEHISDLLMLGIGLVLAVSMAAVAVGEQEGRARLEHALRELSDSHERLADHAERVAELSTAKERNRLAREIHDSLGHHLTAIAVQLEKAEAFHDRDAETARTAVGHAHWSAVRALDEVRHSVRALRDEGEPFSLSRALADLARHADGGRLKIVAQVSGDERGFCTGALTALYRAAQEGLTNAHRHGHATRVSVAVAFGGDGARLAVTDNGRGFPDGACEGYGLRGMRERVALLGGTVDIRSAPDAGTAVTVTLPRAAASPPEVQGTPGASAKAVR
ncbi:sensor histidine kinase [Streptomyces sp. NBC_01410]|uniref:sensor histidine kinase n=1 Tax=Streptomyces sp. NBC_01410 TaxID=2903856 RepID=UPI00324F68EB